MKTLKYKIHGWLEIQTSDWWPVFRIDSLLSSQRDEVTSRLFGIPTLLDNTIAHNRGRPEDVGRLTQITLSKITPRQAKRLSEITHITFQEMMGLYHHTKHCGFGWFNLVQIMRLFGNKLGHENVRLVVWFERIETKETP